MYWFMKQTIKMKTKNISFFKFKFKFNPDILSSSYKKKIYTLQLHASTHKTHEAYTRKYDINTNERAK